MVPTLESYVSNVFKTDSFAQIRYRVFVDPLSRPIRLHLAEWSLRQRAKATLVASSNKELWTFSLDDKTAPAVPDAKYGLKEISTGSFLPSILTLADSTSQQAFPAAYAPLVEAVFRVIAHQFTADFDYVPMGSFLLSPDNMSVHVLVRLLASGALVLTPHCRESIFERLAAAALPAAGARVFVAPNGLQATFVAAAPPPADAADIVASVLTSAGIRVLHEEGWCQLNVEATNATIVWPLELCFHVAAGAEIDEAAEMDWFGTRDPLQDVEDFMTLFAQKSKTATLTPRSTEGSSTGPSAPSFVDSVASKTTASVYPTPPDPSHGRLADAPSAGADQWASTPGGSVGYEMAAAWGADKPRAAERNEDDDLLGGAEEVTEADFNFFDEPESAGDMFGDDGGVYGDSFLGADGMLDPMASMLDSGAEYAPPPAQAEDAPRPPTAPEQEPSPPPAKAEKIMTPPLSPLQVVGPDDGAARKRKSLFSPVTFHPNLESYLDTKYSAGGRFYVPEDHDDSGSSSDSDSDYGDGSFKTPKSTEDRDHDRADDGHVSPVKRLRQADDALESYIAEQAWCEFLSTSLAKDEDGSVPVQRNPSLLMDHRFAACFDPSNAEFEADLQALSEIVVWNGSLLERFLPRLPATKICGSDFITILKSIFGPVKLLSLLEYAALTDDSAALPFQLFDGAAADGGPAAAQALKGPDALPDLPIGSHQKAIFNIAPPHYSFLRLNAALDVLAPGLRFWHVFGFAPLSGRKDVACFVLHPQGACVASAAAAFLGRLKPMYEGSNLGALEPGRAGDCKDGLVPYAAKDTVQATLDELRETCARLGGALAGQAAANVVVLVATPFSDPVSLLYISRGMLQLQERCGPAAQAPAVVVQVVPVAYFAARDTLAEPSPYDVGRFALNVYNRCTVKSPPAEAAALAYRRYYPAFTLARQQPARIEFKLSAQPSSALFAEHSYLHVAYSRSRDRKFVTAAWTDQYGELSRVQSFCLMRKAGLRPRSFEEVYTDIWERTLAILPKLAIHWRLAIVKVGSMDQDELNVWLNLVSHAPENVAAIILSADTDPSLTVLEASDPSLTPQHFSIYSTPESTPQRPFDSPMDLYTTPSMSTPTTAAEHGTPVSSATPTSAAVPADIEHDAILVDLKDETYGVVLGHRLQLGRLDVMSQRFGLACGYLIKPGAAGAAMAVLEISLVHCSKPWNDFLRDILQQYRGLASFGANTGVADSRNHILPWHVAARGAGPAARGFDFGQPLERALGRLRLALLVQRDLARERGVGHELALPDRPVAPGDGAPDHRLVLGGKEAEDGLLGEAVAARGRGHRLGVERQRQRAVERDVLVCDRQVVVVRGAQLRVHLLDRDGLAVLVEPATLQRHVFERALCVPDGAQEVAVDVHAAVLVGVGLFGVLGELAVERAQIRSGGVFLAGRGHARGQRALVVGDGLGEVDEGAQGGLELLDAEAGLGVVDGGGLDVGKKALEGGIERHALAEELADLQLGLVGHGHGLRAVAGGVAGGVAGRGGGSGAGFARHCRVWWARSAAGRDGGDVCGAGGAEALSRGHLRPENLERHHVLGHVADGVLEEKRVLVSERRPERAVARRVVRKPHPVHRVAPLPLSRSELGNVLDDGVRRRDRADKPAAADQRPRHVLEHRAGLVLGLERVVHRELHRHQVDRKHGLVHVARDLLDHRRPERVARKELGPEPLAAHVAVPLAGLLDRHVGNVDADVPADRRDVPLHEVAALAAPQVQHDHVPAGEPLDQRGLDEVVERPQLDDWRQLARVHVLLRPRVVVVLHEAVVGPAGHVRRPHGRRPVVAPAPVLVALLGACAAATAAARRARPAACGRRGAGRGRRGRGTGRGRHGAGRGRRGTGRGRRGAGRGRRGDRRPAATAA
ncbi:mediator complex subunit 13 C-terminal-domain-containing protein [Dipodascopsis tothii]|uniref:mediator complex subunit 13 C-terminal-domain-containing protein n=1 Tax=Dipodascopsis tothii TaxID=44089 RepID=UPI0034CF850B